LTLTNALRESEKDLKSKIPTKDKLVEISEIITVSSWERIVGRYDDGVLRSLSKADLLLNFAKTSLGRVNREKGLLPIVYWSEIEILNLVLNEILVLSRQQ